MTALLQLHKCRRRRGVTS